MPLLGTGKERRRAASATDTGGVGEISDPYLILGLERDADASAIKSAFRALARNSHPDLHPDDGDAEERFKEIQAAYAVLSDPVKRHLFDSGRLGFDARQVDVSQIGLDEILGGLFAPLPRARRKPGGLGGWLQSRRGAVEETDPAGEEAAGITVRVPARALSAGGTVSVTLRGGKVSFAIPPRTEPGALLRLGDGTTVRVLSA